MSKNLKAHLALFAVALIYGANYTIAKEVLDNDHLHPFALVLMRVLAGAALFWLFAAFFIREKVEKKDMPMLALCGLAGAAANQLLFITGLKYPSHINAALVMTTAPILVLVISWVILKEPIKLRKVLGIAIGICGAALLIIHGKKFAYTKSALNGDVLIFCNAMCYGLYLVLVKNLMRKYNPLTVIKWVFTFGVVFVLPFGTLELLNAPMNTFTPQVWMAIAYVLICTTFLAYLLNAVALKHVSPSVVSIYIYLQPLLATSIALMLGKDVLTTTKVAAGILIFSGVFLVSKQ